MKSMEKKLRNSEVLLMELNDKRLIEDFLPVREISSASKKSIELHRWWARL